jgi:predicted nucleic acid-binding protein
VSHLVVDTSVAAKWFLDEPHYEEALRLLESDVDLHAPAFLDIELAHILGKWVRRGQMVADEARSIHAAFEDFPLVRHETALLQDTAFELALAHGRGVYDSLFVALAALLDTRVVTADRRLVEGFRGTRLEHRLLWIGDEVPWTR